MDRRKSIQTIILGAGASALAFHGCKTDGTDTAKEAVAAAENTHYFGRTPEELELIEKLNAEQLFTEHEMETIAVLSTIILPPREPNGGPIEAEVPEFIEFMGKDIPELQLTLKGGLCGWTIRAMPNLEPNLNWPPWISKSRYWIPFAIMI